MRRIGLISILGLLGTGCASMMVQHDAQKECRSQGKEAFVFDAKQIGIPLMIESASARYVCVSPGDVIHLGPAFGADAVSAGDMHGAGIFAVTPGSVAARADLRKGDVVYDFEGHTIASATDLKTVVDSMSQGDTATIKVRRGGSTDTTVTANF